MTFSHSPSKGKKDNHKRDVADGGMVLRRFFENVENDEFQRALENSDDEKCQRFLECIHSPEHRTKSLVQVARLCNLKITELHEMWRRHNLNVGLTKMSSKVPEIMEDVSEDAIGQWVRCLDCKEGFIERVDDQGSVSRETCPRCRGEGEYKIKADKDARNLVFQTMGLTGSGKSGINVNINQTNTGMSGESLESIVRLTGMLSGSHKSPIIDVPAEETKEEGSNGH